MALINVFTIVFSLFLGINSPANNSVNAAADLPISTTPQSITQVVDSPTQSEKLAKCLTQKGAIMYGAYWCSHCQKQKALFGEAFQYIKYQECDAKGENGAPSVCQAAGLKGYPSWKIPGHDLIEGEQSFEDLSKLSDCPL